MDAVLQIQHQVTLASLHSGQGMIIRRIMRGCGAQNRLLSLGLRKGARVEVVRASTLNGPLVVKVCDSQVALGRCLAEAIYGELIPQ